MPLPLFLAAFLLASLAFGPGEPPPAQESPMTEPTAPFTPTLSVTPAEAEVAAGAEQRFQAHINYPPGVRYIRQPVEWRVLEEHGGTVNPGGLYTAPGKPGTYHVEARRQDFPKVCATATVTVP